MISINNKEKILSIINTAEISPRTTEEAAQYSEQIGMAIKLIDPSLNEDEVIDFIVNKFSQNFDDFVGYIPEINSGLKPKGDASYLRFLTYLHENKWNEIDINKMANTVNNLFSFILELKNKERYLKKGLVFGQVQSGKTTHYSSLINRAVDAKIKNIVVLTSDSTDLQEQTQVRITQNVTGIDRNGQKIGVGLVQNFNLKHAPGIVTDYGKKEVSTSRIRSAWNNPGTRIYVVKKNTSSLKSMKDIIRSKTLKAKEEEWLIIDDEADNASIDSSNRNDKNKRSKINEHINEIIHELNRVLFISYTATPFANLMILDREHNLSPEFIQYISPGRGYSGYNKFFLSDEGSSSKINHITSKFNWKESDDETKWNLLEDAVALFIIDCSLKNKEKYTAVINVEHIKIQHEAIKSTILNIMNTWKKERDSDNNFITNKFIEIGAKYGIDRKVIYNINKEITLTIKDILNLFDKSVYVLNSQTNSYEIDAQAKYKILIGGYKFSRGLTIDELTFFYIDRTSKNYDTILQQARWFGYRKTHPTLLCSQEYYDKFVMVSEASNDLVNSIINHSFSDVDEFRAYIKSYSGNGLLPTSRNKMANYTMELDEDNDLSGGRLKFTWVYKSKIDRNKNKIIKIISTFAEKYRIMDNNLTKNNTVVFMDVENNDIQDLLSSIDLHKLNSDHVRHYIDHAEKVGKRWNIAIPSGSYGESVFAEIEELSRFNLRKQKSKSNIHFEDNVDLFNTYVGGRPTDYAADFKDRKVSEKRFDQNNLIILYNPIVGDLEDIITMAIEFTSLTKGAYDKNGIILKYKSGNTINEVI